MSAKPSQAGDESVGTISVLLSDIRAMETMVLYYENRILRKRIALEEFLQSKACREPEPVALASAPVAVEIKPVRKYLKRKNP